MTLTGVGLVGLSEVARPIEGVSVLPPSNEVSLDDTGPFAQVLLRVELNRRREVSYSFAFSTGGYARLVSSRTMIRSSAYDDRYRSHDCTTTHLL